MSVQTLSIDLRFKRRLRGVSHKCAVCGSQSIGVNFGAPTCAPCKAFFRRNARRKEILEISCQILDSNASLNENKDFDINICSQLRHCTSCRLRRCFDVGMKEELVRTDEEKQRYKQMIEINRQRRQEKQQQNHIFNIPKRIVSNDNFLKETDWRFLSNIVNAYDNYCLKLYTQNRENIVKNQIEFSEQSSLSKIQHHQSMRVNNMKSFLSFLLSIPTIQSLSKTNRFYLCKHNIRLLIFPNLHEIEQTCFTESSQVNIDDAATAHVYGKEIFAESIRMKTNARSLLIADPVVTRLWLMILFFSTPLLCYYDKLSPEISHESRLDISQIQQSFINLLWNYLSHRHGYVYAVRIFSNFIRIYLQMQKVSQQINHQVRTRTDLITMNQVYSRAAVLESDMCNKRLNKIT